MRGIQAILVATFALLVMTCLTLLAQRSLTSSSGLKSKYVISNIREGQKLSGDVTLIVRAYGSLPFLEMWIDAKKYAGHNVENEGDGPYASFNIPTYHFADGPHILEIGVGHNIFDRRKVRFQNIKHPLPTARIHHSH